MKKLLAILFAVALILCFTVPAFAEEEAPEIEEEITEAPEEVEEVEEAPVEEAPEEGGKLDYLIEKLTSTSFWITIVSVLGSGSAVIVLVRKYFADIIRLIKQKADAKAIKDCLDNGYDEIVAEFKKVTDKVEAQGKEIDQLISIISVFVVNTVKNPATRSEIVKMIENINEYTGTVSEIVEKVTEAIEEANNAAPKEETPALDALIVDGGM